MEWIEKDWAESEVADGAGTGRIAVAGVVDDFEIDDIEDDEWKRQVEGRWNEMWYCCKSWIEYDNNGL